MSRFVKNSLFLGAVDGKKEASSREKPVNVVLPVDIVCPYKEEISIRKFSIV